jgi:hypothetical protein
MQQHMQQQLPPSPWAGTSVCEHFNPAIMQSCAVSMVPTTQPYPAAHRAAVCRSSSVPPAAAAASTKNSNNSMPETAAAALMQEAAQHMVFASTLILGVSYPCVPTRLRQFRVSPSPLSPSCKP